MINHGAGHKAASSGSMLLVFSTINKVHYWVTGTGDSDTSLYQLLLTSVEELTVWGNGSRLSITKDKTIIPFRKKDLGM